MSLIYRCLQIFVDIFNFIQTISAKWASEESESGNDYIDTCVKEILNYKLDFIRLSRFSSYKAVIFFRWTQLTSINVVYVLRHIKLDFVQLKQLIIKLLNFEEISFSTNQIPSLTNNILHFMSMNKEFRVFLFEKIFLFFNEFRNHMSSKPVTGKWIISKFKKKSSNRRIIC